MLQSVATIINGYPIVAQFVRFASVGLLGTSCHYLTLMVLVGTGLNPVTASACGFIVGALINYTLNRRFTFRSAIAHRTGLPRFLTIAGAGLLLNTTVMALLTVGLGLHYLLAQLVATGLVLFWNFFGNRLWTFREVVQ